jgi:hypothetical protein
MAVPPTSAGRRDEMISTYTIDDVAKHMLTIDRSFPHADDGKTQFQALYAEVRKVFPGLTSHDFTASYDRCLDMKRTAGNRPTS